jgi:hypothetical protein
VKRWREEVLLLKEEMRRCLVTLDFQANWWTQRAQINNFDGERLEGASAYAHYQVSVRCEIAARFESLWSTKIVQKCREFEPGTLDLDQVLGRVPTVQIEMEDAMEVSDEEDVDDPMDVEEALPEEEPEDADDEDMVELENLDEEDKEDQIEEESGEEDLDEEAPSDQELDVEGFDEENPTLKEMLSSIEEDSIYN